ncbi:MAG TPA: DUF3037 domain-containing protein [Pyrinomonadaceae bacterium]|jgi:hypothetical protein|nr:DUF3037 domain-containing protein [Pyrinomonadaceae bacterium]
MPELCPFDYAVIRVVPKVEREEFINAGVILSCPAKNFLKAKIELDPARLASLDPSLDPSIIQKHLDAIPVICEGGRGAGPIGRLPARARFHWLVAPRSTIIQTSPVHTGFCDDGDAMLEHLVERMVRTADAGKK